MPSYANQIAAGSGMFRCRVTIAGWPSAFVDDPSLVRTLSDGRTLLLGLDPMTIRIAARADLARATLSADELTLEVVDDDAGQITAALSTPPTLTTRLTSSIDHTTTTITVADTSGWPSSGVIHIHNEAISYTGKTSTTFTGCTRGIWGTRAMYHYTGDGERARSPRVTNRPASLLGRDVTIALFGRSDSATGDGETRWLGVCRSDRTYQGGRWSIAIAPRSYKLEQMLGGDLEEPSPIRGITLPSGGGLRLRMTGPAGSMNEHLAGHWETQDAFVADVNAAITSATSAWTWDADASLLAESRGPEGWRLVYSTGGTTAHAIYLEGIPVAGTSDAGVSPVDLVEGLAPRWQEASSLEMVDPADLATGRQYWIDVAAPMPRAVVGGGTVQFLGFEARGRVSGTELVSASTVYLGGTVAPSADMLVGFDVGGDFTPVGEERDEHWTVPASAADTAERTLTLDAYTGYAMRLGPTSRLRLLRVLAGPAYVWEMINVVITLARTLANASGTPSIRVEDFDYLFDEIAEAAAGLRIARRWWIASEGVSFGELLAEELKLLGCYLAIRADGRLALRRLRAPMITDPTAAHVTASNTASRLPGISYSPHGSLREVVFQSKWDPLELEHKGIPIRARDLEAGDPTTLGGVLEIAPRSHVGLPRGTHGLEIDPSEAYLVASHVLGLFGGSYATITIEVGMGAGEGDASLFSAQIGDTVAVTSPFLPALDGTRGLVARPCTLIGHDWSPYEGRGTFELLATFLRVGGYAPGFPIASQSGSGTSWTLTLTTTGLLGVGEDLTTWWSTGDRVRIIQRDTATPTTRAGTVTTVTATTVAVTLTVSWTPGSDEWWLGYRVSSAVNETPATGRGWAQDDFAFVASSARRLTFASGDVDAKDFAP